MNEDRISQLPDPLICQILEHLPTKDSVKTSVLSTRWRSLWLFVPSLKLSSLEFPDFGSFVSFGESFFHSIRVSCLDKLKLDVGGDDYGLRVVSSWIDAAIKRKLQHLDFHSCGEHTIHTNYVLRLCNCATLVCLKLYEVTFDDPEFVSLPCLKTLHLKDISYPSEATFRKLISGCPVLEELNISINEYDDKIYQVHCRTLNRLTLMRDFKLDHVSSPGVVIDAPLLCCLSVDDHDSTSFIVNILECSAKLDISIFFGMWDFDESRRSSIHSILSGISRVGDLTICVDTFVRICQYSEVEPLPRFAYMSSLDIGLYAGDLKWLPTFLESCPNLKSLTLGWYSGWEKMSKINSSSVPKCLLSSLEFVEFKVPLSSLEFVEFKVPISGLAAEIKVLLKEFNSPQEIHSTFGERFKE